jgi:plastocyanin
VPALGSIDGRGSRRACARCDPCGEGIRTVSRRVYQGRAFLSLGRRCSIRSQSMKGSGMRRAQIRMGITLLVATLAGSLAVPSMASDRSRGNTASRLAVSSLERVKIVNFAFRPRAITIAKGTRVRWTNRGSVNHTTTSNRGLWDSGVLAPGAAFGRVFRRVGTFKYHCTIHPTLMHGKIIVS